MCPALCDGSGAHSGPNFLTTVGMFAGDALNGAGVKVPEHPEREPEVSEVEQTLPGLFNSLVDVQ